MEIYFAHSLYPLDSLDEIAITKIFDGVKTSQSLMKAKLVLL